MWLHFFETKKNIFSVKTSLWWQLVGFQFDHIHHIGWLFSTFDYFLFFIFVLVLQCFFFNVCNTKWAKTSKSKNESEKKKKHDPIWIPFSNVLIANVFKKRFILKFHWCERSSVAFAPKMPQRSTFDDL